MTRPTAHDSGLPNGQAHSIAHPGHSQRDVTAGEPVATRHRKDVALLAVASFLLLMLAAAQGYVSFRAQYTFIDHAKHVHVPSILEALGLDTGAVIFALLALALACRGRQPAVERILNVACALGSLTMNLLAANLASPRSVTVWVLPSALYALTSDRLIAVMRRWVQAADPGTPLIPNACAWRIFAGLTFWFLRLVFDAPGTLKGFRRWVLAVAPVAPGVRATAPGKTGGPPGVRGRTGSGMTVDPDHDQGRELALPRAEYEVRGPAGLLTHDAAPTDAVAPGETKRAALIRLYERCGENGDPRYCDRTKAAALAGEIARQIGYHPGTARRELSRYLAAKSHPGAGEVS